MRFQLHRLTGHRALLLAWAAWFSCLIAMPVTPIYYGDPLNLAVFILANIALLAGLSSYRLIQNYWNVGSKEPINTPTGLLDWPVLPALVLAGVAAIVARLVDYFVIREIPLTLDPHEVRRLLADTGPNIASLVYILLFPALYAGGILGFVRIVQGRHRPDTYIALAFFFSVPLMSFLFGGRAVLFLVFTLTIVTLIFCVRTLSMRFVVYSTLALVACFFATMALFLWRITFYQSDMYELTQLHGFAHLVPIQDAFLIIIRDAPAAIAALCLLCHQCRSVLLAWIF